MKILCAEVQASAANQVENVNPLLYIVSIELDLNNRSESTILPLTLSSLPRNRDSFCSDGNLAPLKLVSDGPWYTVVYEITSLGFIILFLWTLWNEGFSENASSALPGPELVITEFLGTFE